MARKKKPVVEEEPQKKDLPLAKRIQALDGLFAQMSKQGGIIAGRTTVDPAVKERMTLKYYPMPIPEWNAAANGIPVGRMVIFSGHPDSGKTGAAMSFIAYNQKIDPDFVALWVESEDSIDADECAKLYHIDLDRTYFISTTDPKTQKTAFGAEAIGNAIVAAIAAVDTHINVVVINSLKMLVPMVETKKNLEEDTMAVQARYNSKLVKKLVPLCAQRGTSVIMVQHLTTNMSAGMYGNQQIA